MIVDRAVYRVGRRTAEPDDFAARHGETRAQVALAWLLRRSPVMLPIRGTLSLGHLRENLAATQIELGDDEFQLLR